MQLQQPFAHRTIKQRNETNLPKQNGSAVLRDVVIGGICREGHGDACESSDFRVIEIVEHVQEVDDEEAAENFGFPVHLGILEFIVGL